MLLRSILAGLVWYIPKRSLLLRPNILAVPRPHCPLLPKSHAISFQNVIPPSWDFIAP